MQRNAVHCPTSSFTKAVRTPIEYWPGGEATSQPSKQKHSSSLDFSAMVSFVCTPTPHG
jgi:hypothetical protein